MASSYVVKRLAVASTTRRSPLFVVPYFHRPAAALAISNRRAFAATPIPKYSYANFRSQANRLWFNFTGFVNRFSPIICLRKILNITPHTFSLIVYDSRLVVSGDELGCKVSLNFPGIEEMKETDEGLRIVLDTGMGNLDDYGQHHNRYTVDSSYTLLEIDIRAYNGHKQGICLSLIYLPAGLKDAIWKTEMTKDGLLIIDFKKVKTERLQRMLSISRGPTIVG